MPRSERKPPVSVKKLLLILIGSAAGLAVLIAGGTYAYLRCAEADRDRDEALRTERAQGDAARWVQEKYGFAPEIIDVSLEQSGALFDAAYTGNAVVWASDGDVSFRVRVADEEARCGDDYQKQEITDALLQEVNRILPGGESLSAWFSDLGETGCYFHEKYTGGNLRSLLAEHENMRFVVGYVNTDFSDAPDFPLLRECKVFTELYSFDSAHHLQQAKERLGWFEGAQWAAVLTGGCYVRQDGSEPFTYHLTDYDDFRIMYTDSETAAPGTEPAPPVVTADNGREIVARFREEQPRTDLAEGNTRGWKVVADKHAYYLFYPVPEGDEQPLHFEAVIEAESASEQILRYHRNMYRYGDYYVLECSSYPIQRIAVIEGAQT